MLLVGDSGVGKSALLVRFTLDQFHEQNQPTIGERAGNDGHDNAKRPCAVQRLQHALQTVWSPLCSRIHAERSEI